jgi:hypothetical protein
MEVAALVRRASESTERLHVRSGEPRSLLILPPLELGRRSQVKSVEKWARVEGDNRRVVPIGKRAVQLRDVTRDVVRIEPKITCAGKRIRALEIAPDEE